MSDLRPEFHHDIDGLQADVARLGATVVELIPRVTDVLLQQDLESGEIVIEGDDEIDARAIDIEERALMMLALQAPMAGDLRKIAAALKLAPEIERSADLCVNVCKAARRIHGHSLDPRLRGLIQRMGDQAAHEYKEAVETYVATDAVRAAALDEMDDYLDDLHVEFIHQIFASNADGTVDLQTCVQLAMVARFYERLGDHAVNLSERVMYIGTGRLPEHEVVDRDTG